MEEFTPTGRRVKSLSVLKELAGIDPSLSKTLQEAPGQVFITSANRSSDTNSNVGGVKNSYHLSGKALDLRKKTTSQDTLNHFKQNGYEVIDEGDHYHLEPSNMPTIEEQLGKATAPTTDGFKSTGRKISLQQLRSSKENTPDKSSGLQMPTINLKGLNFVNPKVKNSIDAGNTDATTRARLQAEQNIKESINKELFNALSAEAEKRGVSIEQLTRKDFMNIGAENPDAANKLYESYNPKFDGMSGDAAKIKEIAEGGLRQTNALGEEIMSGNKLFGAALPWGLGDRKTAFIKDDLVDLIGRLRSGGAITEGTKGGSGGEAARFERLIPGWMDFTKEEKLYKLNELGLKFQGIAESLKSDKKFVPFKVGNEQTQAVDQPSDPYLGLSPEEKAILQEAEKQGY